MMLKKNLLSRVLLIVIMRQIQKTMFVTDYTHLNILYHTHFNNLLYCQQNKLVSESGKEKGMSVMIFSNKKKSQRQRNVIYVFSVTCFALESYSRL